MLDSYALITFIEVLVLDLKCLFVFFARYAGEVNVAQAELPAFLQIAVKLKVRGLSEVN